MASLVGIVSKAVGEVFAVAADGSRRILHQGDKLFVGEQLVTGHEGAVAVAIAGGGELTLGRDSSMPMSNQLVAAAHHQYADSAPAQAPVAPSQQDITDVKALQAAIAAGQDPSQVAEATAAGPSFSAGGNAKAGGGHSFVLLTEIGGHIDPDIGFPTGPLASGPLFPRLFDGIPSPEQAQAAPPPEPPSPPAPPAPPVDGVPTAGNASAVVDEDGLPGGIQGNDGLPGVGASASGSLGYDFGADGPGTFAWSTTGLPALTSGGVALSYSVSPDGHVLTASANGQTVFTLSLTNLANGTYELVLQQPLDHPQHGVEDDIALSVPYTLTDGNGTPASGNLAILINDDSPTASLALDGEAPSLLSHDAGTRGGASESVSADFASAFKATLAYGADGAGSVAWHYSLNVTSQGEASGLSSGGQGIHLYLIDGVVVGSTAASAGAVSSANTVFSLAVDAASGKVTLTQYAAIDHALPGATSGFDSQQVSLGSDLVQLQGSVTITDRDGDPASASQNLDLGGRIGFADDGPSIGIGASGAQLGNLVTQDADTIGGNFDTATTSFAAAFAITSQNAGADTPAAVSWSYALKLDVAEGTQSGLNSAGQKIYLYEQNGQIIGSTSSTEASVDSSNTIFNLKVDGSGNVTLTQYAEIDHALPGATGNYAAQQAFLGTGLVSLDATATITDYDGDKATSTASLDLGNKVAFDDDGPSISVGLSGNAPVLLHTQDADTIGSNFDTATTSFAAAFAITSQSAGADTPASVNWSYALKLDVAEGTQSGLNSAGQKIYLYEQNGQIIGSTSSTEAGVDSSNTIFSLKVDGSGNVTLTQYAEIDHALPGATSNYAAQQAFLGTGLVSLDATATITDYDGDKATSTASLDLGNKVAFDDDGPSISVGLSGNAPVLLHTQDADTIGANFDTATTSFAAAFAITSQSAGADTPASVNWSYALKLDVAEGTQSGLNSAGQKIYLYEQNGQIIGSTSSTEAGVDSSNTIFSLKVDGSGNVTLTQYAEIDHALPGATSNYAAQQAFLGTGLVSLDATATITDYDGDKATSTASLDLGNKVAFDDDGPSISVGLSGNAPVLLHTQDADTIGANFDTATTSFAAAFAITSQSAGADTPASVNWSYALKLDVAEGTQSGLNSAGQKIYLYEQNGQIIGSTSSTEAGVDSSNTIFSLKVDGSGNVTLTQYAEIDHALPGATSNYAAQQAFLGTGLVSLQATATITDFDGDKASSTASLDLGNKVAFDDDGPSICIDLSGSKPIVLLTHDADTIGSNFDTATTSFAAAFAITSQSAGADTPASVNWSYALKLDVAEGTQSGLNSAGQKIYLYEQNGQIIGSTSNTEGGVNASNTIFNLKVDGSGNVTLTQYAEIDHALPGATSNYATQQAPLATGLVSLQATATITDYDGDKASSTASLDLGNKVAFADDGPSISVGLGGQSAVVLTQDADTIGANSDTASGDFTSAFVITSQSAGADAPASAVSWSYSLKLLAGQGADSGLSSGNATIHLYDVGGKIVGSTATSLQGVTTANTVFDLRLDGNSGKVILTQYSAIQHDGPGASGNYDSQVAWLKTGLVGLEGTASITDYDGDKASSSQTLDLGNKIGFADDGPTAVDDHPACLLVQPPPAVNLTLVLDVSGSMQGSKLAQAKAALINMLHEYASMGLLIQVSLISFATSASAASHYSFDDAGDSGYTSLVNAINGLQAGGNTNYEAALNRAQTSINADLNAPGADPAAINRVYFISDGEPTTGSTNSALNAWQSFLAAHNGSTNNVEAFAVGVGTSITDQDLVRVDSHGTPVIVTDPSDLSATLVNLSHLDAVSGNVLANDLPVSADGTVRITQVSIGGETFAVDANGNLTNLNPSASHATGSYNASSGLLTISTDNGTLTLYLKDGGGHHAGDYTYAVKASVSFPESGQISESFQYTIVDGDGDTASANLDICVKYGAPILVVGSNASDTDGSTTPHIVPSPLGPDHGTIAGSFGNDVLIGDVGGVSVTTTPGKNYNIALIIDTSGSMADPSGTAGLSRMALAKAALINLLNQIKGHDGTINLALVSFADGSTLTQVHGLNSANVATLISAINSLSAVGGTNYEAALKSTVDWFNATVGGGANAAHDYINLAFFLTDGNPTTYIGDTSNSGTVTNYHDIKDALDVANNLLNGGGLFSGSDHVSVNAIGIGDGINSGILQFFDNTSTTGTATLHFTGNTPDLTANVGQPQIINTAEQLQTALQEGFSNTSPQAVGHDHLVGGDGNDILFGDVINTDALSWTGHAAGTHNGAGYQGLLDYLTAANGGAAPSQSQVTNYIVAHAYELNVAGDTRGGNDILEGGKGDDLLFGQGGNDTLLGGDGNDILFGGMGDDTLTGGAGADQFVWQKGETGHDVVTDFNIGEGDSLNLADLLQGEHATADSLAQYLTFSVNTTTSTTTISVNPTGATGGATTQTIDLANVDLVAKYTDHHGGPIVSSGDTHAVLNGLLADHALKVDTV
ncbi:retention module-containing protein [Pseudomonas sp. R3.Fl]|uniref:retention module-containing protein n=1 Tax=Pseudomonas sp. R3.Fl TaxID=2928708 RepID=UPI00201DA4DD|nr:retention module-containing protein [Pseudomonas sp. R3.Fl]MCL6692651.1 retention module-containing protein [Pseudomonas sp. R3.Fl]